MELDLTRIFVKVVQNGSFSKAASLMKIPKSTVSKSVTRLETETGTKLLARTTRSLTLTAAGRAFYDTCLGPVLTLEDARKSLSGKDSILTGLVRITAPEDLGSHIIAPAIAELTARNKGLSFELEYTDKIIDLVKDGFDLAVRIGKISESSFRVKRIGEFGLGLVASPRYLKGRDRIKGPRDLIEHDALSLNDPRFLTKWPLKSTKGFEHARVNARISTNQMTSLLKMAINSGGIALVPLYLAENDIKSGRLVHVLPEWRSPGLPVSVISPLSSSTSARLKITHDHLVEALKTAIDKEATK